MERENSKYTYQDVERMNRDDLIETIRAFGNFQSEYYNYSTDHLRDKVRYILMNHGLLVEEPPSKKRNNGNNVNRNSSNSNTEIVIQIIINSNIESLLNLYENSPQFHRILNTRSALDLLSNKYQLNPMVINTFQNFIDEYYRNLVKLNCNAEKIQDCLIRSLEENDLGFFDKLIEKLEDILYSGDDINIQATYNAIVTISNGFGYYSHNEYMRNKLKHLLEEYYNRLYHKY